MNILITRHDKIGDFITTLPLIKAIKEQYSNTNITVLVSKINFEFAKSIDFIDDVILYNQDDFFGVLKSIKAKKFDVSISAFIDNKVGILLFLSGIKIRIAPATKLAQIFFNKKIVQRRSKVEKREWEYNLDLGKVIFSNLSNNFTKPLLNYNKNEVIKRVVFHCGFGGSSDGNLKVEDYLKLAKSILNCNCEIVFTFGPDDKNSKKYILNNLDFKATIKEFATLMEFCSFLANSFLFVSTSTGPMHLAGAVNIRTLSFFGNSLFASDKRWGTISNEELQNNFLISKDYSNEEYLEIEKKLQEVLKSE